MVTALARFAVRRRRVVLAAALLFVVASIALGTGVVSRLSGAGFDDPAAASTRANAALARQFHTGTPNFLLLVRADAGVDSPAATQAAQALVARLAGERDVSNVVSYWTAGRAPVLRSTDGTQALVLARLTGSEDHATTLGERLQKT